MSSFVCQCQLERAGNDVKIRNQRMCTRCSFKLLIPVCAQSLAAFAVPVYLPQELQQCSSLGCLGVTVPVPSACVTLIYSATQRAPSFGQEDEQQLCSPEQNPRAVPAQGARVWPAPDVPLPPGTAKRPQKSRSQSLECSCFHTTRKQEQTAP